MSHLRLPPDQPLAGPSPVPTGPPVYLDLTTRPDRPEHPKETNEPGVTGPPAYPQTETPQGGARRWVRSRRSTTDGGWWVEGCFVPSHRQRSHARGTRGARRPP